MNKNTSVVLILLSALVIHDFFKLESIRFFGMVITYLRVIFIAFIPIILHPKFKFEKYDLFFDIFIVFSIYGLIRICGNYSEFLALYFVLGVFLLLYTLIKDKSTANICIDFIALFLILFCIYGYFELFTGFHFVKGRFEGENVKMLANGMYFNENDFSAFLTVLIFYMLLSSFNRYIKVLSIALALGIIYINGSQICLLGLLSFFFLYNVLKVKSVKKRFIIFILTIIAVVALRKLFVLIILRSSIYWRVYMYKFGIQVCLINYLFGIGIGNYDKGMYSVGYKDIGFASSSPHCIYLELAGQFGIVWTLLLLLIESILTIYYFKNRTKEKNIFLFGLMYMFPFIGLASSSSLAKNYTYLNILMPILFYKFNNVNESCFVSKYKSLFYMFHSNNSQKQYLQ